MASGGRGERLRPSILRRIVGVIGQAACLRRLRGPFGPIKVVPQEEFYFGLSLELSRGRLFYFLGVLPR